LPLLEAMAFYKPVLCSSLGSLPEVAGDAALYFDPRNVDEIAARIEEIETNQELVKALIKKGQRRLAHFGDPAEMAKEYLDVFYSVIRLQQTSECL
jgi:glycosyltransferase involved in cell wall biosynthesis